MREQKTLNEIKLHVDEVDKKGVKNKIGDETPSVLGNFTLVVTLFRTLENVGYNNLENNVLRIEFHK